MLYIESFTTYSWARTNALKIPESVWLATVISMMTMQLHYVNAKPDELLLCEEGITDRSVIPSTHIA